MVLVLPVRWLLAAMVAAMVHELCHIAAVYFLGGRITMIQFRIGGAKLTADLESSGRELAAVLAGPMGSLMLLFFCHGYPELSVCGFLQGAFNLLPVYPLDGGRALRCALEMVWPLKAEKIMTMTQTCVCIMLAAVWIAGIGSFSGGILPMLLVIWIIRMNL